MASELRVLNVAKTLWQRDETWKAFQNVETMYITRAKLVVYTIYQFISSEQLEIGPMHVPACVKDEPKVSIQVVKVCN